MAFKNPFFLVVILALICATISQDPIPGVGGEWALLQRSVGISAMHMQLLHNNKVVIFDRTEFGPSNLSLPAGKCPNKDCTAHSILYDVASNTFRPLMVQTNVWCSSGAVNPEGTLIQTGGFFTGDNKIRLFTPCKGELCDWFELPQNLTVTRWYASDQILPDGRVIVVGGRNSFSYEFFPKVGVSNAVDFPFLRETNDPLEENNLYPFLYLLPDGNLYVFANQRSILLDYKQNKILREFPQIPGEKRSYPSTGSSVMLPLNLTKSADPAVEVLVCGGAIGGAYTKAQTGTFLPASKSCGRIRVTDPDPKWVMEDMPMRRVMPDMVLLPNGHVVILNGAAKGTAGWNSADEPVYNPVIYLPEEPDRGKRFKVLNPTMIARMYHSAAILLPDGSILVGGSNPYAVYNFTSKYPTELSVEAFYPPNLAIQYAYLRPSILSIEGATDNSVSYGQKFSITVSLGFFQDVSKCRITMVAPTFSTHSFAMSQRVLVLYVEKVQQLFAFNYKLTVHAPRNANIAPPGYYMLFVVHQGVPCHSVWFRLQN